MFIPNLSYEPPLLTKPFCISTIIRPKLTTFLPIFTCSINEDKYCIAIIIVELKAIGTLQEFLDFARIKESPSEYPDDMRMMSNFLPDHERIIKTLRTNEDECEDKYHYIGTNDFLISIMQNHEKMALMLELISITLNLSFFILLKELTRKIL
jgi:hypothetical protein